MSFSRETVRVSAQQAIYEVVKWGSGALWFLFGPRILAMLGQKGFGLTPGAAFAWGIVLAILLAFSAVFLWASWLRPASKPTATPTQEEWNSTKKEIITGKVYEKEQVEIDSKAFVNCEFKNATLLFRGNGPFDFLGECKFTPPLDLRTDHPAVNCFLHFLESYKQLPGAVAAARVVDALGKSTKVPPMQLLGITVSPAPPGLQIQKAEWGIDNHWLDVTTGLRAHITNNRVDVLVVDETFAIASHLPGYPKFLKVRYMFNGSMKDVVVAEGQRLIVPEMPEQAGWTSVGGPNRIYRG